MGPRSSSVAACASGPTASARMATLLEAAPSGDRRADAVALATRIAARFERDIGDAPEQWWGAFQPFWPDLRGEAAP